MTIEEAARRLREGDDFIITSHEMPDADGLGAEYALLSALRSLGKKARAINAEGFSPKYRFMDPDDSIERLAKARLSEEAIARSTVVIVDTNDLQYTGAMADAVITKAASVLVLDHHEVKGADADALCSFPDLSSTSELVYRIVTELGCRLSAESATALFAGIVFDTGSFAYSKTLAGTFEVALDLVRLGANPWAVHSALYESSGINVLLLRKAVMATLELHAGNRIAVQTMTADMLRDTASAYEDSDDLINVPLQGASIEVSVFLKETLDGSLRCSLRSKGAVNVAQVAQSFGGGGHRMAAGFRSPFPLDTIKSTVIKIVEAALPR